MGLVRCGLRRHTLHGATKRNLTRDRPMAETKHAAHRGYSPDMDERAHEETYRSFVHFVEIATAVVVCWVLALALGGMRHAWLSAIRGELRDFRHATTASFNALRDDFVDLRDHVDRGFTEIRGKLDAAAAGQQQIVGLLQTLTEQERPDSDD